MMKCGMLWPGEEGHTRRTWLWRWLEHGKRRWRRSRHPRQQNAKTLYHSLRSKHVWVSISITILDIDMFLGTKLPRR